MTSEKEIKHLLECLKEYSQKPRTNYNNVNAIYFTLLTAQRSKNIRFARWEQIDFKEKIWTIKANEMKVRSNGDNVIPLCESAMKILQMQKILNGNKEFIFASRNGVISESFAVKFFKFYDLAHTIHGFRSTFKSVSVDKSDEILKLGISDKVAEMILHHTKGDEIEKAYNRTQALTLKRKLLEWYECYLKALCEF